MKWNDEHDSKANIDRKANVHQKHIYSTYLYENWGGTIVAPTVTIDQIDLICVSVFLCII